LSAPCRSPRVVITQAELQDGGAHAIYIRRTGAQTRFYLRTSADHHGERPWTKAR